MTREPSIEFVEATLVELDRAPSRLVSAAEEGSIVVITRHGLPVAMLLSLENAVTLLPAELVDGPSGRRLSEKFVGRDTRRRISRTLRGR